jgi:triacylglycerol lipase
MEEDCAGLAVDLPDQSVLVAFRGTASLDGWSRNLRAELTPVVGFSGRVHAGFAEAFGRFLPWIESQVKARAAVHLTGHSFGGAIATLASTVLTDAGYAVQPVYTFGSPRVGDAAFAAAYAPTQFRIINQGDPVPDLPPEASGYYHVGMAWTVSADLEERPWWSHVASLFSRTVAPAQALLSAVRSHALDDYERALASIKE